MCSGCLFTPCLNFVSIKILKTDYLLLIKYYAVRHLKQYFNTFTTQRVRLLFKVDITLLPSIGQNIFKTGNFLIKDRPFKKIKNKKNVRLGYHSYPPVKHLSSPAYHIFLRTTLFIYVLSNRHLFLVYSFWLIRATVLSLHVLNRERPGLPIDISCVCVVSFSSKEVGNHKKVQW